MESNQTMAAETKELTSGVYHRMYQALEAHEKGHISYQEMKRLWHEEKDLILQWHKRQQEEASLEQRESAEQ